MEAVSLGKYFYAACGVLVLVACIGLIVARYHKPEPEVQMVAYQDQKSQPVPEPTSLESVPVVVPEKSKTTDPVVVEQKMEKKQEPVTKLVQPAIQEEKKTIQATTTFTIAPRPDKQSGGGDFKTF